MGSVAFCDLLGSEYVLVDRGKDRREQIENAVERNSLQQISRHETYERWLRKGVR